MICCDADIQQNLIFTNRMCLRFLQILRDQWVHISQSLSMFWYNKHKADRFWDVGRTLWLAPRCEQSPSDYDCQFSHAWTNGSDAIVEDRPHKSHSRKKHGQVTLLVNKDLSIALSVDIKQYSKADHPYCTSELGYSLLQVQFMGTSTPKNTIHPESRQN